MKVTYSNYMYYISDYVQLVKQHNIFMIVEGEWGNVEIE